MPILKAAYKRKILLSIKSILPKKIQEFIRREIINIPAPKNNQSIPCKMPTAEFINHMNFIFKNYQNNFEDYVYHDTWRYTPSFGSYTHYLYTVVSYYNLSKIYEIGTYNGASCMMLMNHFIDKAENDFLIHSIDIKDYFRVTEFSKKTQERLERHREKIWFIIGDSTLRIPDIPYDLVVIDGSHKPKDVYKDFLNVKNRSKFILVDDLHLCEIYEKAYRLIIAMPEVEELFRVYTTDDENRDPHCIGLIKIKG